MTTPNSLPPKKLRSLNGIFHDSAPSASNLRSLYNMYGSSANGSLHGGSSAFGSLHGGFLDNRALLASVGGAWDASDTSIGNVHGAESDDNFQILIREFKFSPVVGYSSNLL